MITHKKTVGIVALALAVGFVIGSISIRSSLPPISMDASDLVSIMIDYGDGVVNIYDHLSIAPDETLIELLQRTLASHNIAFVKKEYSGLGSLVTKIGNYENGTDEKYWQYWVNNVSPSIGASVYRVRPGDIIEWKFIHYKENSQ